MEHDNGERVHATSWPGAPDGSAYDSNVEAGAKTTTNTCEFTMDATSDITEGCHIANAVAGNAQLGIHTGQLNSIVLRRKLALRWIEQQQKCYLFLPISPEDTPDWEQIKNLIIRGPHGVRYIKPAKDKSNNDDASKPKPSKPCFQMSIIINADDKYHKSKMEWEIV
jgi:hypothetical protein